MTPLRVPPPSYVYLPFVNSSRFMGCRTNPSFSMSKKVLTDAFGKDLPKGVSRRLEGKGYREKYTVWKMEQDKKSG